MRIAFDDWPLHDSARMASTSRSKLSETLTYRTLPKFFRRIRHVRAAVSREPGPYGTTRAALSKGSAEKDKVSSQNLWLLMRR